MGLVHARNISESKEAELRYIVDADQDKAAAVAERLGSTAACVEQALNDPDVCAVVIATPTSTHADLIECAAAAGKAIFCEKPIDLCLARADVALGSAASASVPLCVGFQRRFDPAMRALWQDARKGRIGTLQTIRITSRDPAPPSPEYLRHSGGLFRDMMIHDFDTACWLLGEPPASVHAVGSTIADPWIADFDDADTAVVTLCTKSGRICTIENTRRCEYGFEQKVELFGSEGSRAVGLTGQADSGTDTSHGEYRLGRLPDAAARYATAYRLEMDHFLQVAAGQAVPEADGRAGRLALALAEAADRSWRVRQQIEVGESALKGK